MALRLRRICSTDEVLQYTFWCTVSLKTQSKKYVKFLAVEHPKLPSKKSPTEKLRDILVRAKHQRQGPFYRIFITSFVSAEQLRGNKIVKSVQLSLVPSYSAFPTNQIGLILHDVTISSTPTSFPGFPLWLKEPGRNRVFSS